MSIELKRAVVQDGKNDNPSIEFDFKADGNTFTAILAEEGKDQKFLIDLLRGKKIARTGKIIIDGNDKVNKFWGRRHVKLLKSVSRVPLLSIKDAMYFSLWANRDFFVHAKSKYIENKFQYLSYRSTKDNKSDIDMRERVDKIIAAFISSTSEIENQWIKDFQSKMNQFHLKKINEVYGQTSDYIKALIRDYVSVDESGWSDELYETFLESLWDKVYSFLDIASSCHCEYNAKTSKNKAVRKLHKELNFHQHLYVVKKYLKQIELRINDLKRQAFRNRFILRALKNRIIFEMERQEKGSRRKILAEIISWRKLTSDQRVEFVEKQEQIFFSNLLDEANQVKGKIVEIMHSYHQKVLTFVTEKISEKTRNQILEEKKLEIKTIRAQALDWTESLMDKLEIKYDWKHKETRKARLNRIYFRLFQMFYNKRHNVLFAGTFGSLSRDDSKKLIEVLTKLNQLDPEFCPIFIENDALNLPVLNGKTYRFEKNVLLPFDFAEDLAVNQETYNDKIFYKYNRLQFQLSRGSSVSIAGQKIKLKQEPSASESALLLNPFFIKTDKKNSKDIIITYNIKELKTNPFKDPNMQLGVTPIGSKIFYYQTDGKPKSEIVITEDSIIKTL